MSEFRSNLLTLIEGNPGLHFREILRVSHAAIGKLQYHLRVLEKRKQIHSQNIGNYLRYYSPKLDDRERIIIAHLRLLPSKMIITDLMEKKSESHQQIQRLLGLSGSSTSWYLNKLVRDKIIRKEKSKYVLCDELYLQRLLLTFKEGIADRVSNNFISLWEK